VAVGWPDAPAGLCGYDGGCWSSRKGAAHVRSRVWPLASWPRHPLAELFRL
jgi:hypothetical protein